MLQKPVMLKTVALFYAIFILFSCSNNTYSKAEWKPGEMLFPVTRNGRWGFINQTGAEVIEPKFRNIGPFTDSLTAARLNGTWGFINPGGEFVIPPLYDYVLPFSEGYAAVWEAGKPAFINSHGKKTFALPDSTLKIDFFIDGKAAIRVMKNDTLFDFEIDQTGTIVPATEMEYQQEYPAVVTREKSVGGKGNTVTEYAVRDSLGQLLVPFGQYDQIESFRNGFAKITIELPRIDYYKNGFINRKGELVFMLPLGSTVFDEYFSEGFLAVNTSSDTSIYTNSPRHITWYDTTGKIVFVKQDDEEGTPFKNGRAFAGEIRNWYLMDNRGNQMGENRFEWIPEDGFKDNMAIVAAHNENYDALEIDHYGVIDTLGNYLITPKFNAVHNAGFQAEGLLVALNEPLRGEHYSPKYKQVKKFWGLIDRKGAWIFPAQFTSVDPNGFKNGLLYAEIDSLYGYVDPKGKFVWSAIQQNVFPEPEALNVDRMLRAYCYGFSNENKLTHPPEDKYRRNYARLGAFVGGLKDGQPGILVKTDEPARFQEKYKGLTAYVYNAGTDTLKIDVQDNRLYLVMQALNSRSAWQDIEYSPSSWCGNSYYNITLNPDEYWKFEIPVYDGDLPATLRLAFTWKRKWKDGGYDTKTVYSNTFSGKINPAQFWRQQGHSARNIMDPYNE